jgi:competence protein ComEA
MSIRERLDSLSRGELGGLVILVVATLLGAGLWYMRSLPRPVDIAAPVEAASPVVSPISRPTGSAGASAAAIIVDVAGWVREPGVYEFTSGDRVIDAIDRAGGPRKGAELTTLNLAAPLTDGTQIVIPKPGSSSGDPGSSGDGSTSGGTTLININSASETELEGLPGVGPVTAAAIVDYRTQNGPFATVDDLIDVTGIGPSTLEQIRPFATV